MHWSIGFCMNSSSKSSCFFRQTETIRHLLHLLNLEQHVISCQVNDLLGGLVQSLYDRWPWGGGCVCSVRTFFFFPLSFFSVLIKSVNFIQIAWCLCPALVTPNSYTSLTCTVADLFNSFSFTTNFLSVFSVVGCFACLSETECLG